MTLFTGSCLLKIAVWKIQKDGGATSALARAKDTPREPKTLPPSVDTDHTRVGQGGSQRSTRACPTERRRGVRRPNLWFGPANILYRADRARALSWQRNINVQGRSSRTAAADGRLLRKVIGSNEGTGAQRIDRSRAPSARTLAVDSRWPPPWGLPSKGTAAEDAQSCTRARTIRRDLRRTAM